MSDTLDGMRLKALCPASSLPGSDGLTAMCRHGAARARRPRRILASVGAAWLAVACSRTPLDPSLADRSNGGGQGDAGSADDTRVVRDTSGVGTREMAFARCQHTATLLPSGQVLLAGGRGTTDPTAPSMLSTVAPAELYDPATARFRTTGAMTVPRASHTATLLQDGKVLVIGGVGGTGVLSQAELYDPESGEFAAAGTMTTARIGHQATLLPDGRVLVTGGCSSMNYLDLPAEAEIYNPLTGAFRSTGPMYQPRADHTATHLASGKVLILGGRGMSSVELFDGVFRLVSVSESGEWVSYRSSAHTATLLPDGQVLVAGGWSDTWRYDYSERAALYQPSTRRLADVGALGAARAGHTATPA